HALPVEHFHRVFAATAPVDHQISYSGVHWSAGPPVGQVSHEVGRPMQPVAVAPPRPGVVERVHIGAAGAPSSLPAGQSFPPPPAPQSGQPTWGRPGAGTAGGAPQPLSPPSGGSPASAPH